MLFQLAHLQELVPQLSGRLPLTRADPGREPRIGIAQSPEALAGAPQDRRNVLLTLAEEGPGRVPRPQTVPELEVGLEEVPGRQVHVSPDAPEEPADRYPAVGPDGGIERRMLRPDASLALAVEEPDLSPSRPLHSFNLYHGSTT